MARTQQKPASPQHAEVIHLLETVEQSLLSQDFDTYANLISLPLVVTTRKARFVYTERAHLHRNFTTWQRTIRTLKATRLEQRLQSVAQIGTKGLIVDYDTLVLSGKRNVLPRFKNLMFLNQTRHGLRIEQIVSGVCARRPASPIWVEPGEGTPLIAPKPELADPENA